MVRHGLLSVMSVSMILHGEAWIVVSDVCLYDYNNNNYCICKAQTLDKVNSKRTANQSKTHTHTHISRHARTHAMKPTVGVVGVEQIRIIIRERKTSEFLGTS